ncbi:MAG: hypothetical protein ABW174_11240 [Flavitalea sp.]
MKITVLGGDCAPKSLILRQSQMKHILFIFLSALMLNNSVDIDSIATGNNFAGTGVIDDVDSVWEMLIEKFTGDSGFTSDLGNDERIAKNKTTETFFSFYFTGNIESNT